MREKNYSCAAKSDLDKKFCDFYPISRLEYGFRNAIAAIFLHSVFRKNAVDVVELIFRLDFLLDNPSCAVAVLAFAIFGAVVDRPEAAAGFADADFHRFLVEGQIFTEAVKREFFFQRLNENAAGPAALGAFKTIALEVDADAEAFAFFADMNFHGFRIEFHETHSLSENLKFLVAQNFSRENFVETKPIITAAVGSMSS